MSKKRNKPVTPNNKPPIEHDQGMDAEVSARPRSDAANVPPGNTRRDFMKQMSAAGALLGFPLLAPNALASDDDTVEAGDAVVTRRRGRWKRHTLFFNLSHVGGPRTAHYLHMAGRKYRLSSVQEQPLVLALHRRTNAFLRSVPDQHITHHVVGVELAEFIVSLGYWTANENTQTGTWEMTGMHMHIPTAAMQAAYQDARQLTPKGPLPLSGKRSKYGVRPAQSLRDMREEAVLVDTTSFAQALVGVHPDLLSVMPATAAIIHTKYLARGTDDLSDLLSNKGPAAPAGMTSASGAAPWATLLPVIDDTTGKPFKRKADGLNQYYPEWDPTVGQAAARTIVNLHPKVKDDESLGIDMTPYNLNDANKRPSDAQVSGKCWARRDGIPTVHRTGVGAPATTAKKFQFKHLSTNTGLSVSDPSFSMAPDGKRIQITFDNVSNWFLRYLGVWVQFFDPNDKVIPSSALPPDTYPVPADPDYNPRSQDKPDAIFLGIVPPPFAVGGIPMWPGSFSPTIYVPEDAHTVRILYTGLGLSGLPPPDPADVYTHGAALTVVFNYGLVGFMMAAGASENSATWKLGVGIGGGALAAAVSTIIGQVVNQGNFIKGLGAFTMAFMKVLLQTGNNKVIAALVEAITLNIAEDEVEDAIPVVGQIAQAVAVAVGAIQLAETSIEVCISPPACIYDCVFTHNLQVTFLPDKKNTQFPDPPSSEYLLYYKVSYLFDDGTAHTQTVDPFNPKVGTLTIQFNDIPRGGQVNISIGFYMRHASTPSGQNDWCAGYATTGLVSNTGPLSNEVDVVPPPAGETGFRITQNKIPITSNTRYLHSRKTTLDVNGNHRWTPGTDGPPYIPPSNEQQPSLSAFESITVRQGTAEQQGYVGYAWTAFSNDVMGCSAPARGQFDQFANLNTDAGGPDGANAQMGYINSQPLCGFKSGVRIGYNLLTHKSANMYLDTTNLMIRPVTLDPPSFAGPASGQSFGMLNLDSTRCLLHPAGHIVSINNQWHKIETLKLPTCVVSGATTYCIQSDTNAAAYYLARTHAGHGMRPGLIDTPVAVAITADGVILVLEDGNNRIQAFDVGGNPVPYFKNQKPSAYFLELDATEDNEYLDLAVEFSGYVYVLSKDDNNTHRLDIYHPSQTGTDPICTTMNLNAAKLTVDFWRSVYTLNYEILRLPDNRGIPGFTEPSVSVWGPSLPT